jgi:hypothetical protein
MVVRAEIELPGSIAASLVVGERQCFCSFRHPSMALTISAQGSCALWRAGFPPWYNSSKNRPANPAAVGRLRPSHPWVLGGRRRLREAVVACIGRR